MLFYGHQLAVLSAAGADGPKTGNQKLWHMPLLLNTGPLRCGVVLRPPAGGAPSGRR